MSKRHPGFRAVQERIASEGYGMAAAGRILGYAKAHASPEAKRRNPALKHTAHGHHLGKLAVKYSRKHPHFVEKPHHEPHKRVKPGFHGKVFGHTGHSSHKLDSDGDRD